MSMMLAAPMMMSQPVAYFGDIPDDFVARYLFDGDFADEAGAFHGANVGSTFLSSGDGPGGTDVGINTGGGAKYVDLPVALAAELESAATISFAVRVQSTAAVAIVLAGSDISSFTRFFIVEFGNGSNLFPRVVSSPAGSTSIYRSAVAGVVNAWHHVVIRTTGGSTNFRFSGVNVPLGVDAGADGGAFFGDVESIDKMRIGYLDRSSYDTGGSPFDLAFLTLYDRYLPDAECAALEGEW